jgi:hypothetical protein
MSDERNENQQQDGAQPMGPFEVVTSALNDDSSADTVVRNLDCKNYCTCLNVAVALNWESFTCAGCNGDINQSLNWRAGQSALRDSVTRALCPKPNISMIRGTKEN